MNLLRHLNLDTPPAPPGNAGTHAPHPAHSLPSGVASDAGCDCRINAQSDGSDPHPAPVEYLRHRYSDQPMSLGTRLFGMGGTSAIILLILGGALFTWRTYTAPPAQQTLNVFDVAPPAAPPEPESEKPPGPEQEQREKPIPKPERPQIKPPEIQLPSVNPLPPPVTQPVPDPGPPIERTTAPESKPAPPAPQQSNAKPTWEGLVMAALNKVKRYPPWSMSRREQGVPYIRFTMNREGRVLSSVLEKSSGFPDLDREAVALPRRASPLPKPPDEVKGDPIELVVPVQFFLSGRRR
jgi:protein TonB